jgi:hypothetical protein
MTTYKEQKENKKNYVLLKDSKVLGTFGNLKKLCDFMKEEKFSYWTLARKKIYPIEYKGYIIFWVKHH